MNERIAGTKAVAQRIANAEADFIAWAMESAGLTREQANAALAAYRKAKVVKIDAVSGTFHLVHGAFGDVDVLRRAGGIA